MNTATNNSTDIKRYRLYIFLIILLFVLLRLPSINHVVTYDEHHPIRVIHLDNAKDLLVASGSGHPPLYTWSNYLFQLILGDQTYTYRISSLFFSLLSIIVLILIAKHEFGKKASIFAGLIIALSAWSVIGSNQIHLDIPYLSFFYLLSLYFYLKYEETNKNLYLILMSLSFIGAMLTKVTGILFVPIVIGFIIFRNNTKTSFEFKKIKSYIPFLKTKLKVALKPLVFLIIALIVVSSFIIFTKIYAEGGSTKGLSITELRSTYLPGGTNNSDLGISAYLAQLFLAVVIATPFIIGLASISFQRYKHKYLPYFLWIAIILLFYFIVVSGTMPSYERWLGPIMAPIAILAGAYLSEIKWSRKDVILFSTLLIVSTISIFFLNNIGSDILPLYPKSEYQNRVLSLDWNFVIPITGNAGPTGFYISFPSIIFAFSLSTIALVLFLLFGKLNKLKNSTKVSNIFLIIFLAISLAFSFAILAEHSYGVMNYNVNSVYWDVIEWSNSNNLREPIYVFNNYAVSDYYLHKKYSDVHEIYFTIENDKDMIKKITDEQSTVLVINFPQMNKNSDLWQTLMKCRTMKTFYDKDYPLGYAFEC